MNNIDKFYTDVNIFFELEKIDFMNHGYYPTSSLLNDKNETFKNQKSLYLSLFKDVDTNNKVILDVGCGRGGGINTLDKYFNFKEIYACDVNEKNIQYCKNNNSSNINYKTLNALNLEYPDNFFDIVTNVESSHCYENPSLFFLEIKRILKPGGIFLYADCGETIKSFHNFFYLFKNIIYKNITENVQKSCFEDITNFNNLNIKQEIKDWLVFITKNKYDEYLFKKDEYIFYKCFNDNEKNGKYE